MSARRGARPPPLPLLLDTLIGADAVKTAVLLRDVRRSSADASTPRCEPKAPT